MTHLIFWLRNRARSEGTGPHFHFSLSRLARGGLLAACVLARPFSAPCATTITNQPASQTIFCGDPATFRIGASGTAPLSFQWYRNGARISSATATAYTVSAVSSNDQGAGFSVTVSNTSSSVTSQVALLTVDYGAIGPFQTNQLLSMGAQWKYNENGTDVGGSWMLPNYPDSTLDWLSGPGVFDAKWSTPTVYAPRTALAGETVGTQLGMKLAGTNICTFYFRTHFNLPWQMSQVADAQLQTTTIIDDGAALYLNGEEGYRVGVDTTAWNAWASRTVGDPVHAYFTLPVTNLIQGDNLIAAELHQANAGSSDITFGLALSASCYLRLRDTAPPTVAELVPAPGTVPALDGLEVHFSEGVKGVSASDLLINGRPATNVLSIGPELYVFKFAPPATGPVHVAWSATQFITDLSANSNRFAGGSYNYTVDPMVIATSARINEFMAFNDHTLVDDMGNSPDWIELYNANENPVDLAGWYLTDNPAKLAKWRFPTGTTLLPKSYLIVWASGLDHTNPLAPLHTNFKLSPSAGSYLELVYSDGATVVSAFAPYPQQFPDVSFGRDRLDPTVVGYFTNATPGAANATLGPGFGPEVEFSSVSRTFLLPFTLTLSTTDSNAVIRYLLLTNGAAAAMTNVPNSASTPYTGPITISSSTQVRARAFPAQSNYFPGPMGNETYLQIWGDVAASSSSLPIVVLHDMGGGAVAATADQFMTMQVFDTRSGGRSSMLNPPDVAVQGIFHRRGQATFWNPKSNLRVETKDAYGDNLDIELLGMPADNDWVFYGVDKYDKSFMHNPLAHELFRELGRYSSRTRFVEVYLKDDSGSPGPITSADYNGIYVLEEKIKVGKNRVDFDELQPSDTNAIKITGGYLLSIDKWSTGDPPLLNVAGAAITYLNPDYYGIASSPPQQQYISNYLNHLYAVLNGPNWTDSFTGYPAYIDLSSWIDYHLLQTLVFNVDALRISSYFYKPRNRPIVQGPLWDFDRCFGTRTDDDGRGFDPRRWRSAEMDGGTDMFNPGNTFNNPWYGVLFNDPDFWQRWIDRYQELRQTVYHLTNITAKIDYFASQVRPSVSREYARWGGSGNSDTTPRSGLVTADSLSYVFPGTYQGEVDFNKFWFSNRVDFMDKNFLNPPIFSSPGGPITSGFTLTITTHTIEPDSIICYTLDGTDPRLPGGAISPTARSSPNSATINLTANARVFARNWNAAHSNLTGGSGNPPLSSSWSGPTVGTFVVATPALAVTEIMYDPAPAASGTNGNDQFEFIELKNVGLQPINLLGMQFTNGIHFTFSPCNAITSLGPGQYLVLAADLVAFKSRYPAVTNVAGQYTAKLNNAGDRIYLEGALREPILDFSYNPDWYPVTARRGFSLVIRNESGPFFTWTNPASWRASTSLGGSPGGPDPAPVDIPPILITEALTHTDLPERDTIELYNPTANPVAIGGWFLTDDHATPVKLRIPDNTTIGPGRYLLFDDSQFNSNGSNSFALSSLGDETYLFSGDGTNITGYQHGFAFGAQHNGVTFGRYVTSDGLEHFVTEKANTLGVANAGPKIGPVIINEIMYSPPAFGLDADTADEYIELRNFSEKTVPLYDPLHAMNTWSLEGAVHYNFPLGVTLSPWSCLLVVSFDPFHDPASLNWFRTRYKLGTNTLIFGPYQGHLSNQGERLGLYEPDKPEIPPSPIAGFVPQVLVEDVHYSPLPPWPLGADATGNSLQRMAPLSFADDPTNWACATPSPGSPNSVATAVDSDNDGLPDEWEIANGLDPLDPDGINGPQGDPDGDGMSNRQEYLAGTNPRDPQDFLRFELVALQGPYCLLQFTARAGRAYSIEASNDLAPSSDWSIFLDNIIGTNTITAFAPLTQNGRFYRIKASLPTP